MKILAKIWEKFKTQPDIWFFYGFLLTFTLSVRKIIYFFPIKDNYNEYTAIFLYLSDIFLIFTLLAWVVSILCNKYNNLSSISSAIHNLYNKKWWITCWEWLKLLFIPLFLVIWTFLSILWSDNKTIALYRSAKILEFFFLYIYVVYKCSTCLPAGRRGTFLGGWNILRNSFLIIIFLGLFQAIIGIWQFIVQHSLGLIWLKESLISPNILGVAKEIIGSQAYIRAYGLFPHPNILGGFLFISIILTLLYHKIVPRLPRRMFHVEHSFWGRTIWWLILSIQIVALILTFSKSAILGLIIALIYIFINQYGNVPRGTLVSDNKMFHARLASTKRFRESRRVEHFKRYFILSLFIFGFLLFYFKIDLYSLFIKSLEERFIYLAISIKAIMSHIFLGLGNGQFVLEMQKYASASLEFWQFQPVHNVFLLILSELGIIGLFLFIWFLLELFHPVKSKNVPPRKDLKCSTWNISNQWGRRGTFLDNGTGAEQLKTDRESILNNDYTILSSSTVLVYFKAILFGFIFIMLFDHYFWDIQQGQIMLWMVIGFIIGLNMEKNSSNKRKDLQ